MLDRIVTSRAVAERDSSWMARGGARGGVVAAEAGWAEGAWAGPALDTGTAELDGASFTWDMCADARGGPNGLVAWAIDWAAVAPLVVLASAAVSVFISECGTAEAADRRPWRIELVLNQSENHPGGLGFCRRSVQKRAELKRADGGESKLRAGGSEMISDSILNRRFSLGA
jgi:hypothetical protein